MTPDRSYRYYTSICYFLAAAVVACLFAENFVYSDNIGMLGFREIDDTAFQTVLRRVHLELQAGRLGGFFAINDYAYGWIFWAPLALLTYPFFLLSQTLSIDWPLIVAPRQISLLLTVLSMVVIRKTLKRFDVPEWGCASGVLLFILFPTSGYFSMRFGTVTAVSFFALLTIYLALRENPTTAGGRSRVALSLAFAGGVKLSGLLIAPLALFFVLRRMKGQSIAAFIVPVITFLLALVLLTNPQFVLVPFRPQVGTDYWATLNHFLEVTRTPQGPSIPLDRLFEGAFGSKIFAFVIAVLGGGWVLAIAGRKEIRAEMITTLIWVLAVATYLALTVKNSGSVGSYFTGVSFLFVLGVIGYARTPKGIYLLALLVVLTLADLVGRAKLEYAGQLHPWNHFSYFIKETRSSTDVVLASKTIDCISEKEKDVKVEHIFIDHTAPSAMNPVSHPNVCISVAWNNLSPAGRYCDKPVDFLILDTRDAVGFLPHEKFEERIRATDTKAAEAFKLDRQNRETLASSGMFGNQRFQLACDLGRLRVYKSKAP